jgi:dipeptidyl aminopeptidase/acylaminoacyl peptidase
VPVFMAYGEKDWRVPLVHGEEMRDGLKKNGKTVEYMELEKEEHGIAKEETRYRVYGAIEKFLQKYNPPQ